MTTAAQFISSPNKGTPATLTAANTSTDGTGATGRALIFTAAAGGSKLPAVLIEHLGTNVQSLIRIFRNNGSDPEVAANNNLISEVTVLANTLSQTVASVPYVAAINANLESGERIYACLATAVAAGLKISPYNGGDY
jgi:hypothetical protein